MKKLLTFSVLALFVGALGFTSCKKDNGGTTGLPAPTGLNETNITATGAVLNWTAVQGAASYEVTINNATKPAISNLHPANDLTASTDYTWTVVALDATGGKSSPASHTFKTAAAIAPPSNLAVTAGSITATGATFTWTASTDATVTGYEIRFNGGTGRAVTGTTYTATDLTAGTDYTWDVLAVAPTGKSAYVAGQAFKTSIANPEGLTVTNIIANGAMLGWNDPANGTGYTFDIDIRGAAFAPGYGTNGAITGSFDVAASQPSGLNTNGVLAPETAYTWKVKFTINGQETAWVDGPSFTTKPAVTAITTGAYYGEALDYLASVDAQAEQYVNWETGTITKLADISGMSQYQISNWFGNEATNYPIALIIDPASGIYVDASRPIATGQTVTIDDGTSHTGDIYLDALFIVGEQAYSFAYNMSDNGTQSLKDIPVEWDYENGGFILPYDLRNWFNVSEAESSIFWGFFLHEGTSNMRVSNSIYMYPFGLPGGLPENSANLMVQGTRIGVNKTMPKVLFNHSVANATRARVKYVNSYAPYRLKMVNAAFVN